MIPRKKLIEVTLPLECCMQRAFTREPEFWVISVNVEMRELFTMSVPTC